MKRIAVLLTALILISLTSCRSKKKVVEKEAMTIETVEAVKISESIQMDIVEDSLVISNTETIITNNDESIDIETADPDKEVTLTKEEKNGKTVWTGKNVKNLSISKNNNTTKKVDSSTVKVTKIDSSKYEREEVSNTEVNIDFSKDKKNINIKSTNIWVSIAIGIAIILAVLLIIYLLYKRYRDKIPI